VSGGLGDFLDARITETVATTWSRKGGDANVAPMGVLKENGTLHARLWEGSTTLENVRATGEVVVNVTRDPVVYVEGALGGAERFVHDEEADDGVVRLRDADAWFVCDATRVPSESDRGEVTRWRLEESYGEVVDRSVPTFSRGFASVVEATVHATRLGFRPELRDLYEHHLEVAQKCGGEREREAVTLLREYVEREEDGQN